METGRTRLFVAKMLAEVRGQTGESVAADVWRASGLSWEQLGVKGHELDSFLSEHVGFGEEGDGERGREGGRGVK